MANTLDQMFAPQNPIPMSPGYPSAPGSVMDDPRVKALLDALGQPAQMPVPADLSPQAKAFKALMMGLGAMAGSRGAAPPPEHNPILLDLLARRREREAIQRQNAIMEREAKRASSHAELQGIMGEEERRSISAEREAERKARLEEKQMELKARADLETRLARESNELRRELAGLEARTHKEVAGMRLEGKSEEDKVAVRQKAKEQETALKQARAGILAVKSSVAEKLKTMTPGQLASDFVESMDVLGLEGEYRKQALDYFMEKLGPAFEAYDAANPPTTLPPFSNVQTPSQEQMRRSSSAPVLRR